MMIKADLYRVKPCNVFVLVCFVAKDETEDQMNSNLSVKERRNAFERLASQNGSTILFIYCSY